MVGLGSASLESRRVETGFSSNLFRAFSWRMEAKAPKSGMDLEAPVTSATEVSL